MSYDAENRVDAFQGSTGEDPITSDVISTEQHGSGTFRPNGQGMQAYAAQDAQSDKDYARGSVAGGQIAAQNGSSASSYSAKRIYQSTSAGI